MTVKPASLMLLALGGIPLIKAGDDLATIILGGVDASGGSLRSSDVLVIAQKIVSKAEGRLIDLRTVRPSQRAVALAERTDKDPRIVELILAESTEVLRAQPGVIVVAHRLGFVAANAGIDQSNLAENAESTDNSEDPNSQYALLLPVDPDASCRRIRTAICERTGVDVAVVIIDSVGRAWRNGTVGAALGVSGMPALVDLRGHPDLFGRRLRRTEVGVADELAAAASLVMGQGAEGHPVVLARGVPYARREGSARELLRPKEKDLFR